MGYMCWIFCKIHLGIFINNRLAVSYGSLSFNYVTAIEGHIYHYVYVDTEMCHLNT